MDAFDEILLEATTSVENELLAEDKGWVNFTAGTEIMDANTRQNVVKKSRIYCARDPMAKQSLRLWTDYSFGTGLSWDCEDESTKKALEAFWNYNLNASVLSPRGQHKCSDKLLTDGEIFFAIFLGKQSTIRAIDPLEITEIVTDPDDKENPRYYRRQWNDAQGAAHDDYYCSWLNSKDEGVKNLSGADVQKTQDALIYHMAINTTGQRGIPLIYPALDWIPQYRRFLASRIAVMLALARFAWKHKVKGGSTAVASTKATFEAKTPEAGASLVENEAVDTQQLKTDSGANQAYQDGRMIKLQVCAAVGIPEQYFGDIACYSDDTEVLTNRGWMLHKNWLNVAASTKVASYNPDTWQIEYIYPDKLNVYKYDGKLVHFKNAQTDILVSPNHRMYTSPNVGWELQPPRQNPHKGGRCSVSEGGIAVIDRTWQIQEAQYLFNNPRSHGWKFQNTVNPTEVNNYYDPLNTGDSEAWALFIGYFLSEGYTLSDKKKDGSDRERIFFRVAISQKEGQILKNMRTTLKRLSFNYHEQRNQSNVVSLTIVNKGLWEYLRKECGIDSHNKSIPRKFFDTSIRQRRELLIALLQGDGGKANGIGTGGFRYSSVSKQLANDVMELALSLGYATSIKEEVMGYNGTSHLIWRVAIRNKNKGTQIVPEHVSTKDYSGYIYCFALPKNHIYITRRNGKVAIQGNTGNLATAKTVELPMLKMFQGYQQLWRGTYIDINNIVLEENNITDPKKRYVDIDFPAIAPEDALEAAQAMASIVTAFPSLADAHDVQQQALIALGINDPGKVIDELVKEGKDVNVKLAKVLREFKRTLK